MTDIITMFLFILVFYFIGGKIFPIVTLVDKLPDNITAVNNAFKIKIIDQDNFLGILAQEYYESKSKWSLMFLIGVIFNRNKTLRNLELMGHAISVAYHTEPNIARRVHANNLKNYYPEFKGIRLGSIYEMLLANDARAREWISKNNKKLIKIKNKLFLGG